MQDSGYRFYKVDSDLEVTIENSISLVTTYVFVLRKHGIKIRHVPMIWLRRGGGGGGDFQGLKVTRTQNPKTPRIWPTFSGGANFTK